jgi:hypothetical protein
MNQYKKAMQKQAEISCNSLLKMQLQYASDL